MLNLPAGSSVYLIGIGGVGMTPLALLLHQMGYTVSGSDIQSFRMSSFLQQSGIQVYTSHEAHHVNGVQMVIYSTAIPLQNSEYLHALELGIPCINRLEAVSSLVHDKKLLSITGSYGKSTTTSFSAYFANLAGLKPSYLIGADLLTFSPAQWNPFPSDWFIFETDESRPEFMAFSPYSCIITNIGKDHLQHYQNDIGKLQNQLFRFISHTNPNGSIILSVEAYQSLSRFHSQLPDRICLCGKTENCHYRYEITECRFNRDHFETQFHLTIKGKHYKNLMIRMPGEKVVLDAIMAFALISESAGHLLHPEYFTLLPVLDRRFQLKCQWESSYLIDDEGDSPDVIEEALRIAKKIFPSHQIIPVVQPHRYSRLENLLSSYAEVLAKYADRIILLPVYSAGETPIPGMDSSALVNQLQSLGFPGLIALVKNHQEAANQIMQWHHDKIVFILLGPGDVWQVENDIKPR